MSTQKKSAHILVVEDDADIRESVVEILEDEGHTVTAAADGREALDQLLSASPRPDLILLDLMMPVMSGYQFREEQLKVPSLASIPVLIVTADVNARAKVDSLKAAGFVQKPLKIQPLLDLIDQLLAGSIS
ncbi:MAG TPA: response regulator transcription factor [Polyangiaceae bacterium]|nr:response regulator transcription factor [Polyangiaceae bacterium]